MNDKILAIDFDDTIVDSNYPTIVRLREGAKEYINKLYNEGYYIIIWTCRSGAHKQVAELYLLNHGKYRYAVLDKADGKQVGEGIFEVKSPRTRIYFEPLLHPFF